MVLPILLKDGAETSLISLFGARVASIQGREVTRREVHASPESLFPNAPITWDTPPSTLPDKYGDYQYPAKGVV